MKNLLINSLSIFILPFLLISCFENNEEVTINTSQYVEGQYIISGFGLEGTSEVDTLSADEFGNSYISITSSNDTLVTVRLVLSTEIVDFTWNLQGQNVEDTSTSSEYPYTITPGTSSLNNLHIYITEDKKLKAVFDPALQPNIKTIYASL
ncbi:hypothetical protein EI427_15320 [Flammeovirga pectinis]|uniref:Lipoprotein n=1 Tax=Flammeovirga pectinis TaxID=2494373 RepID=A0A3Q9FSK4_9BACT|nr:hypothetical protein [Flammeovirga pectinis]AZQ63541.1 hypothetical protein EI427_15320 [Flammeovirga pectinis]